jgi:F-type H+-transporting ATPase subunit gamma
LFRSKRWLELEPKARQLITIGKKSHDYARSNKIHVTKHFKQIPEKLSNLDALKIVDGLLELWNNEEEPIKEIIFIAPHYKNSFTFYPVVKTFLPFSQSTIDSTLGPIASERAATERSEVGIVSLPKGKAHSTGVPCVGGDASPYADTSGMMLFNPDKEQVRNRLYEQLIQALFMQAFMELKASEYSSRMIAMQNATDAADRITNDLTRDYNKARQAVITREIAELMGASDAIGA